MLTGSTYVSKMSPKLYIKPYTTAYTKPVATLTKAADIAKALSEFEGTAAIATVVCDAVVDGDYIIIASPYNAYAIYVDKDGAGAKRADVKVAAAAAGCTALLAVTIATADISDVDAIGAAFTAAINATPDLNASYTTGTDTMVVTAWKGGARLMASSIAGVATPAAWAVTDTAGVGAWTEVGALADDYSVGIESEEMLDAEGNTMFICDTVTSEFRFLNLTERNVEILAGYKGTKISMVLADFTDRSLPVLYCINDLLFNVSLSPAGDVSSAPIKMTKRVKNSLTGTYFWTYNDDTV